MTPTDTPDELAELIGHSIEPFRRLAEVQFGTKPLQITEMCMLVEQAEQVVRTLALATFQNEILIREAVSGALAASQSPSADGITRVRALRAAQRMINLLIHFDPKMRAASAALMEENA